MKIKDDITIVLRSVGERTEHLCAHRLSQEVDPSQIVIIRNMPLHQSTQAVCRAAVEAGRKYTLMIGADYIPRIGFISDLCRIADQMSGDWLFVKGTIIDKFLLELRGDQGGPMLYPTAILEQWLKILPSIQNKVTTEATCQKHFKNLGYKTHRGKLWLALHDYEQHYRDIYRSMYVGGRKHSGHRDKLLLRWKQLAKTDPDYQVAIYAHLRGAAHKGVIEADFTKDYGFHDSPFAIWKKEPITDMNFDVMQYEHLRYKP